jgi:hypothetical protein
MLEKKAPLAGLFYALLKNQGLITIEVFVQIRLIVCDVSGQAGPGRRQTARQQ